MQDSGPHNLLAVAGLTRQVAVFTEQGDLLAQGQAGGEGVVFNSTRGAQCERLAWHPARCLLAMGWADGAISFWNREDFRVKEDPKTNQAPVTCLAWADCGGAQPPLLFSGHASGKIGIWKADSQSRPVPVAHYQDREREITHVCSAADPEVRAPPLTSLALLPSLPRAGDPTSSADHAPAVNATRAAVHTRPPCAA